MSALLVLPIAIPMAAAIAMGLLRGRVAAVRLHAVSCALLFATSIALLRSVHTEGIRVMQVGGWPAPFGITLVADVLSAVMLAVSTLVALAVAIYELCDDRGAQEHAGRHVFLQLMLAGICGAFLAGDLFNLYVWFELLLISSFVVMALGGGQARLEAAIKYVAINLVASSLFLTALAVLYANAGTLNMAHLSLRLPEADPRLTAAAAMMLLVAFGIKAAVFPLHFWLPASYHTVPIAVAAIFAGLLTKVGVYALIRMSTLLFRDVPSVQTVLLAVAGITMVLGVLGAIAQTDIRRLLSFHIISQIGYMVLGLALFTPLAIAASIFYIVHHIVVKANLFLLAGAIESAGGDSNLENLGGLYRSRPLLAMLFLLPALSLAGLPPLSGFFAKLAIVRAGLERAEVLLVGVALAVGLLTLFSMMKIWGEAFWKAGPRPGLAVQGGGNAPLIPIAGLAVVTLMIGLVPGPLFELAATASAQLLDPSLYVSTVLGGAR